MQKERVEVQKEKVTTDRVKEAIASVLGDTNPKNAVRSLVGMLTRSKLYDFTGFRKQQLSIYIRQWVVAKDLEKRRRDLAKLKKKI